MPSGLAGVDIEALLDESDAVLPQLLADDQSNPGLILGAAIAGTNPRRDKIGILSTKSSIVGIGDWIEQLVAESTGKNGTGVLPVVLEPGAPDVSAEDLLPVHILDSDEAASADSVTVAGPLGAQLLIWEFATAVAGRLLGINPYDQPDVESAKIAARAFLDETPAPQPPFATDGTVLLSALGYVPSASTVTDAVSEVLALVSGNGYVSVHAYADREAGSGLEALRTFSPRRAVVARRHSDGDLVSFTRLVSTTRVDPSRVSSSKSSNERQPTAQSLSAHLVSEN